MICPEGRPIMKKAQKLRGSYVLNIVLAEKFIRIMVEYVSFARGKMYSIICIKRYVEGTFNFYETNSIDL